MLSSVGALHHDQQALEGLGTKTTQGLELEEVTSLSVGLGYKSSPRKRKYWYGKSRQVAVIA